MQHKSIIISALLVLFITLPNLTLAITLEGQVVDYTTGNPIPDVNVEVQGYTNITEVSTEAMPGRHQQDVTDLAGKFSIDVGNLEGIYALAFSHVAYATVKEELATYEKGLSVQMHPLTHELAQVVVSTGRTSGDDSPGAKSAIDRDLMELKYGAQEVPMLAAEAPSVHSFSWSGMNVGASHFKVRGFDTDRITATVNGVPINDPEDHIVYWQDTPDFLSNTHDIQIERGVSSFQTGPASIGGGIDLATSDAVSKRELSLTLQAGSFNTLRRTVFYRSGLLDGQYNFTGRFSRVTTDGYRDHTGADMWSYFLAAARFDRNMVTRIQIYGGEEEMDAYWWGVDKATLETNRKFNWAAHYGLEYDGERDFFQQPHYILHNQWRLASNLELNQSLFWIQGDGFYEEFRDGENFYEYNLSDDPNDDRETDVVRHKHVTKNQIGWLPRLSWSVTGKTTAKLGLELRFYTTNHWGRVVWASALPDGVSPQHKWFSWKGWKNYLGGYANLDHRLTDKLKLNAGIQVRQITWEVDQDTLGAFQNGYEFDLDYLFINPRIGAVYELNPSLSIYGSLAGAGREPFGDQIFDADNPWDVPRVEKYGREEVESEFMWDGELGMRKEYDRVDLGVNLYGMFFRDAIVVTGFDSNTGEQVHDNAPTSRHLGIEFEGKWRDALPGLTFSGNLSYGKTSLGSWELDYVAYDEDWNQIADTTLNLEGNEMSLFPNLIANLRATYNFRAVTASLHIQHVSKQYMDNRQDDNAALDPYTTLDGVLQIRLKSRANLGVDLEVRGMNLLDAEYEPFGVVDVEYGTPYYVPAAGRRYLAGVTVRL